MKIKEGDKIPNSEFYYLDESGVLKKIFTSELFDNNKTIVIGVPGAFTKVCSVKHLPGYVNNFEAAKKKGITKIICISVNDPGTPITIVLFLPNNSDVDIFFGAPLSFK